MTNGDLLRRFLQFEFLVTDKLTRFNLHYQLSFCLVGHTLVWRTLYFRIEFFGVNHLIDLKSTDIAGIDCYLDARLDVACSGHNTLNSYHSSNLIRLDLSHFNYLFLGIRSIHYKHLILSFKFWRQHVLRIHYSCLLCHSLDIASSLVHYDIKSRLFIIFEVNARNRHVGINHLREKRDVSGGVCFDSVNETCISGWTKHESVNRDELLTCSTLECLHNQYWYVNSLYLQLFTKAVKS